MKARIRKHCDNCILYQGDNPCELADAIIDENDGIGIEDVEKYGIKEAWDGDFAYVKSCKAFFPITKEERCL